MYYEKWNLFPSSSKYWELERDVYYMINCYLSTNANFNAKLDEPILRVQSLFNIVNSKFLFFWRPQQNIAVDEFIAPYRGYKAGFLQYIFNKPNKYGYKFFCANDAITSYLILCILCTGKKKRQVTETVNQKNGKNCFRD